MTSVLDRSSGLPLYGQIAQHLEHQLDSLPPGSRLPSDSALAETYGVNRLTVQEAIGLLVRRGLLTRMKGKGTFVAKPFIRWDVRAGQDASLTAAMAGRGHRVENRLLDVLEDDDPDMTELLGASERLHRFVMVRFVDDDPWSLSSTWIDPARFPDVATLWGDRSSLHALFLSAYGIRMSRATRTFAALPADDSDARLLHVPVASPILRVRGANVDDAGDPVAAVEHRFRGDRIQFSVDLA